MADMDSVTAAAVTTYTFTGFLSSYPSGGFKQVTAVADAAGISDTESIVALGGTSPSVSQAGTSASSFQYSIDGTTGDETYTGNTLSASATRASAQYTFIPTVAGTYSIVNVGGTNTITLSGAINISTVAAATLALTSGKAAQEVFYGNAMESNVFTWGGGATDVSYSTLPAGITAVKDVIAKTLTISGAPTEDGSFSVTTIGGMEGSGVEIN
jgi:hypothetical protein